MDANSIISYMSQYGLIFLFVIVLLENMNLPGFPAGIIMPLAGVWAYNAGVNFVLALVISVIGGVIGSCILYAISLFGGNVILKKFNKKFPKQGQIIDEKMGYLKEKGHIGVFVSRLIPMVRTIIPIPAGILKMNFVKYTAWSALGIFIWNGVLMGAGYFIGESVIAFFG